MIYLINNKDFNIPEYIDSLDPATVSNKTLALDKFCSFISLTQFNFDSYCNDHSSNLVLVNFIRSDILLPYHSLGDNDWTLTYRRRYYF